MADTNITETKIDYEPSIDIQDKNDEIWFDIINRTITPKENQDMQDILVQNDANSRNLGFMIQRYFEDEDLSTKSIRVHYVNSLNQHDINDVHSIQIVGNNSDVLSFIWLVGNKVCIETGNVQFAIEFYNDEGYELYTKPTTIKIEQGIYTVGEIPEPDDWYKLFKQELLDIQNNIDAKNITSDVNLWDLDDGVYNLSKGCNFFYCDATDTDIAKSYFMQSNGVLCVSKVYIGTVGQPLPKKEYRVWNILTQGIYDEQGFTYNLWDVLNISGCLLGTNEKYWFKKTTIADKYNISNNVFTSDGLNKTVEDCQFSSIVGEILGTTKITLSIDDNYIAKLIADNTDSEMSDTSANPIQNKVAKDYIDNNIGDINTALDNIIAIQQALIGGETV